MKAGALHTPFGTDDPFMSRESISYAALCTLALSGQGFSVYAPDLHTSSFLDGQKKAQAALGDELGRGICDALPVAIFGIDRGWTTALSDAFEAYRESDKPTFSVQIGELYDGFSWTTTLVSWRRAVTTSKNPSFLLIQMGAAAKVQIMDHGHMELV